MGYSLKWLRATMRVVCGGRIAEQRAMGDVSSGASQDIAQVTQISRAMVLDWGMSPRLGFVKYSGSDTREVFVAERDYSEDTARLIDDEIRRMVDEAYQDAERVLGEHWEKVVGVAEALLKYETLTADEVHQIMRGEVLDKPTVADLLSMDRSAGRGSALATGGAAGSGDGAVAEGPGGVVPRPA
jgi:cell division protease FtsH